MDLAIVLDLRPQANRPPGLLDRPFGDICLADLALEKLAGLEAPARRLVLAPRAEDRVRVRAHSGLRALRNAGGRADLGRPDLSFACLAGIDADFVLWVNPSYPLLSAERWWRAAEDLIAAEGQGLVSVERVGGPFFSADTGEYSSQRELLRVLDALVVFPPREPTRSGRLFAGEPRVFELDANESRSVRSGNDLSAAEAVWLRSRLALTP